MNLKTAIVSSDVNPDKKLFLEAAQTGRAAVSLRFSDPGIFEVQGRILWYRPINGTDAEETDLYEFSLLGLPLESDRQVCVTGFYDTNTKTGPVTITHKRPLLAVVR